MIQRSVKIQLVIFAVIGALFMTYAGARYVGLNTLVDKPYKVTAYFSDSGGIFSNAAVTERGVTVGKVGSLKLTDQGVAVQLELNKGVKVPANSNAIVADLSFAGEQFVDIQPQSTGGPWMQEGSIIPASRTSIPISDSEFLLGLDRLANSVPQENLRIVVNELGKATDGIGPVLTELIRKGVDLTDAVTANLPQQLDLIQKGQQVLDTANATSAELNTSSANFAALLQQLRDSDADINGTVVNAKNPKVTTGGLFNNATAASQSVLDLLDANTSGKTETKGTIADDNLKDNLPVVLANLITLGQIQNLRLPALKALLVIYPEDIRNGFYNAPGDGTSHFGGVFDQSAPICTAGYSATTRRTANVTPSNVPANTQAGCQLPVNSATDVRGSRNAPRPAGDTTDPALQPGGAAAGSVAPASSSSYSSSSGSSASGGTTGALADSLNTTFASYDPTTTALSVSNGKTYLLGNLNGDADLEPGNGLAPLYLDPVTGF